MRWLVTGAHGLLGRDLVDLLRASSEDVTAAGSTDVDVRDARAVAKAVAGCDVVVNCAAWTGVDDAERNEAQAHAVNASGAANVATAATSAGVRMVQISTDYVFAGEACKPYREDAPTAPASAYGRTKVAGERAVLEAGPEHLVVRTAWLYGAHGPCFPRTIARLARERGRVQVVSDQEGQPTWTADVARVVLDLVRAAAPGGIYHATALGHTSWYGFARAVVDAAGIDAVVEPCTTAQMPRPAPRPTWSVLGHDALRAAGVDPVGPWLERWREAASEVLTG